MKNPECPLGPPKTTPLSGSGFRAAVRIAALSGAVVLAAATASCASPPATGPAQGTAAKAAPAPASQPSTAPTAAPAKTTAKATAPVSPAPAPIVAEASRVAPAAPAPTPSTGYVVKPGDTVGAIAAEAGVDPASMLAANGLGTYSVIVPGQMLKLTGPPVTAPAEPSPAPAPGAAPAPAKAPTAAETPAPVAVPPAVRTIYVAGSGGQAAVDKCIGPIHFTPDDAYSLFIVEHDFCGGWAQFSGIQVGETVTIAGYGTYTVTGRGQVPNPGTTGNVVAALGGMPRAVLQTCIPGTNQMLVIALN